MSDTTVKRREPIPAWAMEQLQSWLDYADDQIEYCRKATHDSSIDMSKRLSYSHSLSILPYQRAALQIMINDLNRMQTEEVEVFG